MTSGDSCEDGKYSVTYKIYCDPEINRGEIQFLDKDSFDINKCHNVLIGKSRAGKKNI